jgi:carbon storage regulator
MYNPNFGLSHFGTAIERASPGESDMLVLMRRRGQVIRVGRDIRFTVLGVVGENVRVGVEAPREVTVDREEVYERKQLEATRRERSADLSKD